jgi:hypothetical protein
MEIVVTNPVYIYGDPDSEMPLFEATGAFGGVEWEASAGYFALMGGNTVKLLAPNQSRTIIVVASDHAGGQATATVQIYGRFPLHAYFPHDADIGQKIEYSQSEDATPESETSSLRGTEYIVFNYVAQDRTLADYKLLMAFARAHRGTYFYYVDRAAEETLYCRFDSDVRRRANQFEHFDLTCVLRGRIVYNSASENIGSEGGLGGGDEIMPGGGGIGGVFG